MQNKRNIEHPLGSLSTEIERKGIVIFDDISSVPVYGVPYVSPYLIICLCLQGSIKAEYDMMPVEFHQQDIAIVFPDHIIVAREPSPDYKCMLIAVSPEMLRSILARKSYGGHAFYHRRPAFRLDDIQFQCIHECIKTLKFLVNTEATIPHDIICSAFDLLSDIIDYYRMQNLTQPVSHDEKMFVRFYDTLVENFHISREVAFYADKLCVSPKYFSGVIKRETGITAQKWIIDYVLIKTKSMLRHHPEMNIRQISSAMGFADQSCFTRFFKNNTGMSPLDYRKEP